MRLLTRYVLCELIKVFLVTLTFLTVLMLIYGLAKQARDQGLGPVQVVRLTPFILPDMLRYTIPATMLFAACSVYGRMSGSNEVLAIKSLGISPLAVLWPAFILAFLLSLLTFWLSDVAVTWGHGGVQRVVIEAVEEIAYGMLRTQRSYATKQFSINVKGVEGRTLILPTFTFQPRGDAPAMTIMAEEAELRSDPGSNLLKIICRNPTVDVQGRLRAELDRIEQELPLSDASRGGEAFRMPARLPLAVIPRETSELAAEIEQFEQELAVQAAVPLLTGEFPSLASRDWKREAQDLQDRRNLLHRLKTEPPRRLSSAFSCLCFVLVGAPWSIWRRDADFMTNFGLCFLPILLVYYPLLAFGIDAAKTGALHPWCVWLGNVLLALCGIWVLGKVIRY